MSWTIEPSIEELEQVMAMVQAFSPDETSGDGVWVRCFEGARIWSGRNADSIWEVTGGASPEPFATRCLPPRIITEAAYIARIETLDEIEIEIPDEEPVAIVDSGSFATIIDLPVSPTSITAIPTRPSRATARVGSGVLYDLLLRARTTPAGPGDGSWPPPRLVVGDGGVAIHADWSVRNGQRSTYRVTAETTGEAMCHFPMGHFFELLKNMTSDDEFVIDIPADLTDVIILTSRSTTTTHQCGPLGAIRHSADLIAAIEEAVGDTAIACGDGRFGFVAFDTPFTAELIDGTDEYVRFAVEICDGLISSDDLLGQLNEANAGLVGGRLWMVDGSVWATIELPCTGFSMIEWALSSLVRQLEGFDVFLGAFGSSV